MGFACLADEVRYRGLQRRGVASDSSCTSIEQSIKQGINLIAMHQTHDQYCNGDVLGHKVCTIPFKRIHMQSHLQMCFKFEFELKPYGCFADRKSTRLNSSHGYISYAVFCLKKKFSRAVNGPYNYAFSDQMCPGLVAVLAQLVQANVSGTPFFF